MQLLSAAMKIIFLILSIFVVFGITNVLPNDRPKINSNATVIHLFEMLKYYIRNGYPDKGLPALDPSIFDQKDLDFTSANVLNIHARFLDGVLTGLGDFQLLRSDFDTDRVIADVCINFPSVVFKASHYEMEGDLYDAIPLAGSGIVRFEMLDFKFCGKFFLKQSDDQRSVLIKNVSNQYFNINQVTSTTQYDGNIDDIVNSMINDLLATYLNRFNQFIIKTYIDKVVKLLNLYMSNFESWQIIDSLL